jgi:predicted GIY-YIG superfamily endonuclease
MVGRDSYIAVYITADGLRGTLYVGVTSQLVSRAYQPAKAWWTASRAHMAASGWSGMSRMIV